CSIIFRMRAGQFPHFVFLGVASFLVSDNHAALPAEHGEAAWHGSVIGKTAVAVQFSPICETSFDVIERERPLHMPRDLNTLPGGKVAVNLASRVAPLCLYCLNPAIKIDIVLIRVIFQILQSPFQFKDWFLKI